MRVLVLGGTRFLGRHLVEACLARGHDVTLFHRGLSDASAFPSVEHIVGDRDRDADLARLREKRWDIVFDTSGYDVAPVRSAARAVDAPGVRYVFVSSISVYSDPQHVATESSPLKRIDDPEHTALSLDAYGALKVACEDAAEAALPGRVMHVRAGLILGPHDNDDRFAFWLRRVAAGGEVLAPGNPEARVQLVDVRDLSAWMLRAVESGQAGLFNATGPSPDSPLTMRALLETLRKVTGSNARFTWIDDAFLVEKKVAPYSEMPFWLPPPYDAFAADIGRAIAAGLTFRPFEETARDAWAWLNDGWERAASARANKRLVVPAGITREREVDLLAAARRAGAVRHSG